MKKPIRYTIRRIRLSSVLRLSFTLTWLVMVCPALCMAAVVAQILLRVNQALVQVQPIDISVFGQQIAQIDILQTLRLNALAQGISRLTHSLPLTFVFVTLFFMLLGAVVLIGVAVLFSIGYNILASTGNGLEVEVHEHIEQPKQM